MHPCIPRLYLGMLIHKTNLVQVIHLMEGFRKAILKSSCSATWPLNTQEKLSGGLSPILHLYSMQVKPAQKG